MKTAVIDLLAIEGAEITSLEGKDGIFIPTVPNIQAKRFGDRQVAMLLTTLVPDKRKNKSSSYKGFKITPRDMLDAALVCPKNRGPCMWIFDSEKEC